MTCIFVWVAVLLTLPIVILLWVTQTQQQRIRQLRRQGWTQRRIAEHLGISRSRVQRMC
jgi:IS30 family transposase